MAFVQALLYYLMQKMSLIGVQNIMKDAEKDVSGQEIEQNINIETEDHSAEIWETIAHSEEERGPIADSNMGTQTH